MIIVICGTSSSGKSSVCEALINKLGDGWLYFGTDGYLSMLGSKFLGLHPSNSMVCEPNDICYANKHPDGTYEIMPGKLCSKLFSTIPEVLEVLAKQDFGIIVDSFISSNDDLITYKNKLGRYGVKFVYLYASEDVIIKREEARGDRLKGSAIHWLKKFDFEKNCDLIVDTEIAGFNMICDDILMKFEIS